MMVPPLRPASPVAPAVAGPSSSRRDPLDSPLWENHAKRILGGGEVVFDDRVQVVLPPVTENQAQVPILVDARALGAVDELVVITEMHPFPQTLRLEPFAAKPFVAFRMKIEQATPIRAAVRKDGMWHVGGRHLSAMGGGCSVPPVVAKSVDWSNVGRIQARAWREAEEGLRLRLRVLHPMDNGLIGNIPVFIVESLTVADAAGATLAKLTLSEAIADDPTLTLLPDLPKAGEVLQVSARDNNGGVFAASVPIPAAPAARVREGRL